MTETVKTKLNHKHFSLHVHNQPGSSLYLYIRTLLITEINSINVESFDLSMVHIETLTNPKHQTE